MQLPFSVEQFFQVFSAYNQAVWPAQIVLTALALLAVVFAFRPRRGTDTVISGILGLFWMWTGIAYHWAFFAAINPLAYGFAGLSAAGGVMFLYYGVFRRRLAFRRPAGVRGYLGLLLILYALLVYPLLSRLTGHAYPALPTFGLPCPTTIFTIGMLAFLARPYPRLPFVVPILWTLVGSQAAFLLNVPQDTALIAAGLFAAVLMIRSKGSGV